MKTTSFGFVDLAESFLKDALSSPPLGGGSWGFQRSVNFSERSGSLRVVLIDASGTPKTKVSIQARQTGSSKDYSIQGWTELPELDKRTGFVLKESNPYRVEEEVFDLVDRLLAEIPERDQTVTVARPEPPPKPAFEPLIPEIQNAPTEAPAEPTAESFDSNQAFIDSLMAGNKEKNPEEAQPAGESADSNQALVDSLLSSANAEEAPVAEAPASTPAEEAPAPEETAPKAKAAKSKKAAK